MVRLVTFDAFGTLFRVMGNPVAAYVREAARHGIHIPEEATVSAFKLAFRLQTTRYPNFGRQHNRLNSKLWWREVVYMTLRDAGANPIDLQHKFDSIFENLFNKFKEGDLYSVFDEVKPVLAAMRENPNVRLGVISNSDGRTSEVLRSLDLAKYFDFVITSYEFDLEKPSADIFNKALELGSRGLLEPISPNNALHIGDDEKRDYLGAKSAGWDSFLVMRRDEEHPPYFSGKVENGHLVRSLSPAVRWSSIPCGIRSQMY